MNYYPRHLGDYAKDTGHLTMLEHGAYTLLLDRYYATEAPIPADQVYRVSRARTQEEKDAVDAIMAEFFTLDDGKLVNKRADDEIAKARALAEVAKENGRKGGRPRKTQQVINENPEANPKLTQEKPSGLFLGIPEHNQNLTQEKAIQDPRSKIQDPRSNSQEELKKITQSKTETSSLPKGAVDDDFSPSRTGALSVLMRQAGVKVTSGHPSLLHWVNELGITDDEASQAIAKARKHKPSPQLIEAAYLDAILREMRSARTSDDGPSRFHGFENIDYTAGLIPAEGGGYVMPE